MNKLALFVLVLFCTSIEANEVSVFGAGDLNSTKPYGLTKTEKYILNNKKELGTIETKVKTVKNTIESIYERIEGLESIYEGDSQKLNATVLKLNKLLENFELNNNQTNKNNEEITLLKDVTSQMIGAQQAIAKENKKNLEQLKKAILNLEKEINKINKSYVSDSELKKNMKQFVTKAEFDALKKSLGNSSSKKPKANTSKKSVSISKLSSSEKKEMLIEAKRLFKKDYFTKAIPMFETLIAQKYKPAESNFYLGEIWYYRKKYDQAIVYFKKSALLYDKASWMPKLLLHSAISFEKTGDLENAANFYGTLVEVYPESNEAKTANKNLLNIQ